MNTSTRRESAFLVLAPVKSDTYPVDKPHRAASVASSTSAKSVEASKNDTSAIDSTVAAEPINGTQKTRRSSSMSSTGSQHRFLKLGPVHFGGDPLESDFADAEV